VTATEVPVYDAGFLPEADGHAVWFEQSGRPDGVPVVYLHGGPGMGLESHVRSQFDPAFFRLMQFDQRGCGRSRPFGALQANTTWHLVDDIERLRRHLGIADWWVYGQSWGCALALAYAQRHPAAVRGLLLQGVYLGTAAETAWIVDGWRQTYPEAWAVMAAALALEEPARLHARVAERLQHPDPAVQRAAVMALTRFELTCCYLRPDPARVEALLDYDFCRANTLINLHYHAARFWLEPEQLLRDLPRITQLPLTVINGRHDVVTPMGVAWRLLQRWPGAELVVVDGAGHATDEPANVQAVTATMDRLRDRLQGG